MKTAFVTGATGFLGRNLVERLAPHTKLVLLTRGGARNAKRRIQEMFGHCEGYENISVVEGDVCGDFTIGDVDEIYHVAGLTHLDEGSREAVFRVNSKGTENLIKRAKDVKNLEFFVHVSTAYVAGRQSDKVVREDELYIEQGFNNPYEESKCEAERLVGESGLPFMIFRPSIIIGHSQTGATQSLKMVYQYWNSFRLAKRKYLRVTEAEDASDMRIRVVGNPTATLNIIPVDCVVEMMIKITKDRSNLYKGFHLTNPQYVSFKELADVVGEHFGIGNIEYVSEVPLQVEKWERLFHKTTDVFTHYTLRDDPLFDRSNVESALPSFPIPKPDRDFLKRLVDYGEILHWKA